MQKPMKPSFTVRTQLRVGDGECRSIDTNCVAISRYPTNWGRKAMNDNGTPVWDNCLNGQPLAGDACWLAIQDSKYVQNYVQWAECLKC